MIMNRYEIRYKARITKVQKVAHVIAKTKVSAKRALASREASPIIQGIYEVATVEIADNRLVPYVERVEFVKKGVKRDE
jgi:hypothetical protein